MQAMDMQTDVAARMRTGEPFDLDAAAERRSRRRVAADEHRTVGEPRQADEAARRSAPRSASTRAGEAACGRVSMAVTKIAAARACGAGIRLKGRMRNAVHSPDSSRRARTSASQCFRRLACERGKADRLDGAVVQFDHHGDQRAPFPAMQFDYAPGTGRRRAHSGILLVLEQRLAQRDPVTGCDEHRGFEAVDIEAECSYARHGRRRLDVRRRLPGERKIEPFRAFVKARWPSFWLSPYRVHSPGLCVPLYAVTGRDARNAMPPSGAHLDAYQRPPVMLSCLVLQPGQDPANRNAIRRAS